MTHLDWMQQVQQRKQFPLNNHRSKKKKKGFYAAHLKDWIQLEPKTSETHRQWKKIGLHMISAREQLQ